MLLKIESQHIFGLPRKIVWKYIKDEKVLGNAIHSLRSFVKSSNSVYKAEMEIILGPLKDVFSIEVKLVKEKLPSYYHVTVKGKGNLGEVNGKADLFLSDHQGGTQLQIQGEANVTGTLSGPAERVLNGGANKGIEKFFQNLEKEMRKNLYLLRKGRKV
ncbi:SRPBCC domain-containing protein [Neobacillus niacini]|uniref:SRPBCC domain-containing protein n=1 Tax=Neobacillus niacini TaxID=86668 RepID=UPI003982DBBE